MKHAAVVFSFLICFILLQGCASRSKNVKNETPSVEIVTVTEQPQNPPVNDVIIEHDPVEEITIVELPQTDSSEITPTTESISTPEPIITPEPTTPELTTTPILPPNTERSFYIEDTGYVNNNAVFAYIQSQKGYVSDSDIFIINLYFEEAVKEGVNSDIAIAQMLHHTDLLRNDDLMRKFNYARFTETPDWLGRFRNEREGVLAHIQHLKFYSKGDLKNPNDNIDPRYSILKNNGYLGKFQTIDNLPWVERVGSSVNTNYINSVKKHLQHLWDLTDLTNVN
jgi:hypothetical protein